MFKNTQFYHSHIRKAIVAFGMLFNNIQIARESDGVVQQVLRVPLAYSPKQKFLTRIATTPTDDTRGEVAMTLPRMGFEITALEYDASRKISVVQRHKAVGAGDDANTVRSSYASAPYNLSISLYMMAKNQDDALQVVEQIFPYFNPDFNVTINDLPEIGIKRDLKITLDSVSYEDDYEGDFERRRSIIWTLNFTMRINFYGEVTNVGYIKQSIAQLYNNLDDIEEQVAQVTVTPGLKADGTPTTKASESISRDEILATDDYGFIVDLLEDF